MSMNLHCEASYPSDPTVAIQLWQTSTDESWKIIGCAHDFSNHQGVEPYLTRYLESRLVRLVRSADPKCVPEYLGHIRDLLASIEEAVSKGAVIEWYVT